MIEISKIKFSKNEFSEVIKVLESGNVVQGAKVLEFEKNFSKYIGVKYAVSVSSGTAALYLGLLALGIKEKDEVITTPFSFIASSNSILYTGAKPVFADINPQSLNIDPLKIEEKINKNTKAILPVHLFGHPCEMDEIKKIARKHHLYIIEDACQAHGAEYKGKKVGSIGDIGCFSFYATKNMTTIEGGMITTNNKQIYEKLLKLRNHGSNKKYHHETLGYNFRMTEINAVLGIEQLKKLTNFNKIRSKNANFVIQKSSKIKNIIPVISKSIKIKHAFHQLTFKVDTHKNRESYLKKLKENGINANIYYPIPIHKQKLYKSLGYNDSLPVSEEASRQVFSVPIHPYLTKKDLDKIIDVLNS